MKDTENTTEHFDIIIIGGGAAGMMAAGTAKENGNYLRILLLEKNKKCGEKLSITGGGRCNITNAEYDLKKFLKNYGDGEQFLYSPFSQFGVVETFSFFESHGLPLVVQARKRAFPITENSPDVVRVMENYARKNNVIVRTNEKVSRIIMKENCITGVISKKREYSADVFIFASGGNAHPETGSTGDGFKWLQDIGHTVYAPTPTIVPLAVKEDWVKILSGVSISFMKITFFSNNISKFSQKGKILFTHFGLSGPLILNNSSKVADLLKGGPVTAKIDLYPDTNLGALKEKILKVFEINKNKLLKNVLPEIFPAGFKPALPLILKNNLQILEKKIHSITKKEREEIVSILKAIPLTIEGLMGYDRAVIADGGVPLSEIDTKTMSSKICPNLFITGDLLNIRRPSGGYSLQLCWTTGFVAGKHAAEKINSKLKIF